MWTIDDTMWEALERDKVVTKMLDCMSAVGHIAQLHMLSANNKMAGFDPHPTRDELGSMLNDMDGRLMFSQAHIASLIPTQYSIDAWKHELVSSPDAMPPEKKVYLPGRPLINLATEPIVLLYDSYGSETGCYILSGHARAYHNYEIGEDFITSIKIRLTNVPIHESFWNNPLHESMRGKERPYIKNIEIG